MKKKVKSMNTKTIVEVAIILAVLGSGYALARPGSSNWDGSGMMGSYGNGITGGLNGMMGQYTGMMNGFGNGIWSDMMSGYRGMMGYGNGATAGYGGMMGGNVPGNGMMGYSLGNNHCVAGYAGSGYGVNATPITIDKAKEAVEKYITSTGNTDLRLSEVKEFDNHFYAEVEEKNTGVHAFELLVNRYTGAVFPEMGPNIMWNTKYGHMNWNTQAQTTITREETFKNAQAYLDKAIPGAKADEVDTFYGYYTIHVQKDGKIYGMLSVNSYTGAVWYHNWHGSFIKILEVE